MSKRNRMAIGPETLENPEHDLDLLTRGPEPEEQDEQPEEIIESAATAMVPPHSRIDAPPGICRACFERGRKAATMAFEAEAATLDPRTRLAAIRAAPPRDTEPHYAVDFHRGVEAVL